MALICNVYALHLSVVNFNLGYIVLIVRGTSYLA